MRGFEGAERFSDDSLMERKIALRIARLRAKASANRAFWWWMALAAAWLVAMALVQPQEAERRSRIKDIATIEGIRDNQLVGYGIVVGLRVQETVRRPYFPRKRSSPHWNGWASPSHDGFAERQYAGQKYGSCLYRRHIPPFSRPGSKMDITVSSAGDARSLEGGLLLMTPLYGPDGQIYAQAQGSLVLGGYTATAGGNTRQLNHPTTARIPGGALIERQVGIDLADLQTLHVVLNDADFHTAEQMAESINKLFVKPRAHAVDSRLVEIQTEPKEDRAALLDKIEQVEVEVYPRARVVVNERTGTVVIGGKVRLQPVSILHGGLSVNILSETKVSQPGPLS